MAATARKLARSIAFGYGAEALTHGPAAVEPGWLTGLRATARELVGTGLPNQRIEAWKYTNLQAFAAVPFSRAAARPFDAPTALLERTTLGRPAHRLVFIDGRLVPALSETKGLPGGVMIRSLTDALKDPAAALDGRLGRLVDVTTNTLAAYNTAGFDDGAVIRLADGVALAEPVHLVFIASSSRAPIAYHPRLAVEAGEGSALTLVESHVGESGIYWSNPVAEIAVGRNAAVRHYKLQNESHEAHHLALTAVSLAREARYESVLLATGAALARHEIEVSIEGEGAEVRLDGAYLIGGTQHSDHTTRIVHKVPRASTREVYKGVLDGRARGVFQGTIVVEKGADKTDAHQLSRTLMLSAGAEVDAKPELMIYADDVKCSHGASSGALDPAQLFYLRSRGIDAAAARALLVEGFVAETLERIEDEALRLYFARTAGAWLSAHQGGQP